MLNIKLFKKMLVIILIILPFVAFPCSIQGTILDIWGTSQGTSLTYTFQVTYSGSVSTVEDFGEYQFSVANIWDNDGNNYTELLLIRQKQVSGSPTINIIVLDDSSTAWDYKDLAGAVSLLTHEIMPLLPINFYGTNNIGLNWTEQFDYITTTLSNYSISIDGNKVTIYHWTTGIDGGTGAHYMEYKYTTWNRATGWLISYDDLIDYEEPANFSRRTLVEQKGALGLAIDIYLIIGLIGIISGLCGIVLSLFIFKKLRSS